MVKIKEGYVMNAREKAEFDRVNALPRKTSGLVAYYYKPQTKYPPRIYVFMHAEIWQDRNRRPMGLYNTLPFLQRPMNTGEIEYHHFDTRLCYHQYEDWDKLLYAEQKEAAELDAEKPGTGTAFLEKLQAFRERYVLSVAGKPKAPAPEPEDNETNRLMRKLIKDGSNLSTIEIGDLLDIEQRGEKRMVILILLRELYKEKAGDRKRAFALTPENLEHKARLSQNRTRRNFVRRVFARNPLFALEEIRSRYPDYGEHLLAADLKRKTVQPKRKKHKPITDLRRCQLQKLAVKLKIVRDDEKQYNALCEKIAILAEAHRHRLPIPISVRLEDDTQVYHFNWKTREGVVKSFVSLANTRGMTHGALQKRYQEIISSNYSF